ncbi:hypothetical protein [Sphingomonas sp. TREG-RG-20F-R18-01]|uniref:hypothetical protein n=1 Tax=Sphingomonas sp. TREG-RG-20F-R18-01 TaxID=2914982 RepID=UPI001F56F5C1|nr:hypothetical protein [Sphingomonas sp. TREG-RG-20F-R18-01]
MAQSYVDPVHAADHGHAPGAAVLHRSRMSWQAVFAGVTIAIAIQIVLGLLGTGIGMSLVDPVNGSTPSASGFGIGAALWWVVSTIVALGAGSYAASRLAGLNEQFDGFVHGLVIWGVTLIITLYLLTSAVGSIIGGTFRTIGGVASAAGTSIGASAPTVAKAAGIDVQDQAAAYLDTAPADPAQMTPQEAQKEVAKQLPAMARGGAEGNQAEARIVDIVAAQRKIPRAEAAAQVARAKQQFVQAKDNTVATAKTAADAGASAAAGTSFTAVIALLLGAGAAGFAGAAATRRRGHEVRRA